MKDDHLESKSINNLKWKNIFLWGSHGTGKTIMLEHILRMRIAFYKRIGVHENLKIFIGVGSESASTLLEEFKENFKDLLSDRKLKVGLDSFKIFQVGSKG